MGAAPWRVAEADRLRGTMSDQHVTDIVVAHEVGHQFGLLDDVPNFPLHLMTRPDVNRSDDSQEDDILKVPLRFKESDLKIIRKDHRATGP